jgi:CBS domain-containing protein
VKLELASCVLSWSERPLERFEAVRATEGRVRGGRTCAAGALERASVECHRGEYVSGADCRSCSHFVDASPAGDRKSIAVHCLFLGTDPVDSIMTRTEELVVVDARQTVGIARERARAREAGHLLVSSRGKVIGALSADALELSPPEATVASRLAPPARVIPRTASLAGVAQLLRDTGVDPLVVVDGDDVWGVVGQADLRRANIPCGESHPPDVVL